jgi:transcriptional regulator with XRE-family HTH domain
MTNKEEFKVALIKARMTMADLAKAIGISSASLSYKVNNKRDFMASEIKKIADLLRLTPEESTKIFFAERVDE